MSIPSFVAKLNPVHSEAMMLSMLASVAVQATFQGGGKREGVGDF